MKGKEEALRRKQIIYERKVGLDTLTKAKNPNLSHLTHFFHLKYFIQISKKKLLSRTFPGNRRIEIRFSSDMR